MNAFTSEDMTAYFINVPANKLELWMWMESERILHPVFREFYAERDVVFEERRMRTDSTPLGKFQEEFNAMFWESSPYAWPVVGWPSDIPAISKAQADEFYATYYSPQNITLILVGDFRAGQGRGAGEEIFRAHPARPEDAAGRRDARSEAAGREAHECRGRDESAGGYPLAHRAVPASATPMRWKSWRRSCPRAPAGSTRGWCWAAAWPRKRMPTRARMKWEGYFNAGGEAKEGHKPEEVEQGIYDNLEKLKQEEVPPEELQKVKNNFAAGEYRRLSSNFPILMHLIRNDGEGDWREINEAGPKIQAVTAADVKRVANKYFTKENRAVAVYTRKPGTSTKTQPVEEKQ